MKKLFLLAFTLFFIFSCDIFKSSSDNDDDELKDDTSLSSLIINGQSLVVANGVTEYEHYLISSEVVEQSIEVAAKTTNSQATIKGTGNYKLESSLGHLSGERIVELTVTAQDDIHTQKYIVRIYSAPTWIKFPLDYAGGKDFLNKKAFLRLHGTGVSSLSSMVINRSKPEFIYMPVSNDETIKYSKLLVNIDIDGDGDKGRGFKDIFGRLGDTTISPGKICKTDILELFNINRLKVINIPTEVISSAESWSPDGRLLSTTKVRPELYKKDIETGSFSSIFHNGILDFNYIDTLIALENIPGVYELYLKKSDTISTLPNDPMISLGRYEITEDSDLIIDVIDKNIGLVQDYTLTVMSYDTLNQIVTFSEPVNKSLLESALTVKEVDSNNYLEFADIGFTITMIGSDNKTFKVNPSTSIDPDKFYRFSINNSLESLAGKRQIFPYEKFFCNAHII